MSLPTPSNISQVIYASACQLFDELWNGEPIRLLGVRSSKLADLSTPTQLSLFDLPSQSIKNSAADTSSAKQKNSPASPSQEKLAALDKTLDSIRQKYGNSAVIRGSFLSGDSDS